VRYLTRGLLLAILLGPTGAQGQEVRGTLQTHAQLTEFRPLAVDSIPRDQVEETPAGRFLFEGTPVYCVSRLVCIRYRSAGVEAGTAVTQHGSFAAWDLGVQGLSVVASGRLRGRFGGDMVWPRSDDAFDLVQGYAELVRDRYRVRLGRQQVYSGLGRSGFDGLSARGRLGEGWRVDAYAGRSLARALNEPRAEAFRNLEDLLPDRTVLLFGASAQGDIASLVDVTLRYQREIFSDRSALVSERASADIRAYPFDRVRVDLGLDADLALARLGKADLSVFLPLGRSRGSLELMLRRYLPYFELWTIWGFFSPVPYHEAELRGSWAPWPEVSLQASGSHRWYGDPETSTILSPLEDRGWRGTLAASWAVAPAFTVRGSYRLEWGAGAYLSSGDFRVAWSRGDRLSVGIHGTALQQLEEFRLGNGTTYGAGADLGWSLWEVYRWQVGGMVFRNTWENRPGEPDWNQVRVWTSLTVQIGSDPGLAGRAP
jgi:hypothetical protein